MAAYEFSLADRDNTGADDISSVVSAPAGTYRIARPTTWTITVPTSGPDAVADLRTMRKLLWVERDSTLVFNGVLRRIRAKGDTEKASAVLTFVDPMVLWPWRRVRDSTGNFSKPDFGGGPYTVGEFLFDSLANSETYENGGVDSEVFLDFGTDTSTADVYAALGNFPLSIGELATLLANTGMAEWFITASNTASSLVQGTLDVYDRMGTDLSATIEFIYRDQDAANNVKDAQYDEDASKFCNALWYFFDKIDAQHWNANITRDDPNFEDPPDTDIQASIDTSRSDVGYWQDMRFFDEVDITGSLSEPPDPLAADRKGWRRLWQFEQALRLRPKKLAFGTPTEEAPRPWDDWFLGDRVTIDYAGLGIPDIAGIQRVYGFTVEPQDESNEELVSGILTTNDAEEITG